MSNLNIIVFSKDRSSQLELFLRSMKYYFKEFDQHIINVLYTYSSNTFKEGYDKLFTIHNDFLKMNLRWNVNSLNCLH